MFKISCFNNFWKIFAHRNFSTAIYKAMITNPQLDNRELMIFSGLLVMNRSNNVCVCDVIRVGSSIT